MKRLLSALFFISSITILFSQSVNLQWNGSSIRDFGEDHKLILPSFKNEGFSYDENNVFIFYHQKVNEKNLIIKNLNWQKVDKNDLFQLDSSLLPEFDNAGVSYYYNENNELTASFRVGTFKKVSNIIYRLSSFDIATDNSQLLKNNASGAKVGTTDNPLVSGTFYKIKVDKSGVFKITTQFLKDMGINPANVNPKNFRIYGNGGVMLSEYNKDPKYSALQEDAIQVVGESDGIWNDNDYALFYAQGPNGYNLYDTNNGNGNKRTDNRVDRSNNLVNIYDDFAYYFINFDKGQGKRVQDEDVALPATALITRYDDYQVVNDEKFNLAKLGRTFTGDSFIANKTMSFTTKSAILPTDVIKYRTQVIGYKAQGNNLAFNINNLNNNTFGVASGAQDYFPIRYFGNISGLSGNNISINYTPNISGNPSGSFYFDYVEVQYKENLSFNGTQMNFRWYDALEGSSEVYGFSVSNANSIDQIWNVSDVTNASRRVNKNAASSVFNFAYNANSAVFNNEFVAFNSSAAFSPSMVEKISNQDLSSLQNIDYLVLTVPEMMPVAQKLASYHQTHSGFSTKVVDVSKIYNEFSSGGKDITAIRDFITKLNTPAGKLKYVFILGDTSFDYKNKTTNNDNIVPSYISEESGSIITSYVTDDYFVMTAPQTQTNVANILPDLPVGRLPASNISEANTMIDKTLAYYNVLPGQSTPFGVWRMKSDFVVDDDNDGGVPFHTIVDNALNSIFEVGTTDKPEYNIRKLYLDAFTPVVTAGGQRFPQLNQEISNDVSNSNYIFYFGHGGINSWAQERVLSSTEVQSYNNINPIYSRTPLVSTITCEFCLWDDPSTNSVGEQVIKHKTGGAATMITSSRAIDVFYGIAFTPILNKNLYTLTNDQFSSLGNTHLLAKKAYGTNNNHLKVNYLGDPAMILSRPKRLLVIDNVVTPVPGIIRALDFVKINGHIKNADGTTNTNFNGKVIINIFDKKVNKVTLNNDGVLTPILQYVEEGSPIVKASGMAVNGVFTVQFYVPNDINYTIGTGRILAYADNKVFDVFNGMPYQIGDINPNGVNDNEPPKIKLYMNNTNFANGGITNENPLLLACLTDDTGINSTGAGIGHDITVILDGQIINTISLNDFYAPGEGNGCINADYQDFQKGNVTYPFRNLTKGEHQLIFKVWDINNNSSNATLNFIVKDEKEENLVINRLLNWPNPFTDKTYIQFEHNCDDILDVNVQIYTITGKLVRTFSTAVTGDPFLEGYRTPRQAIEWDGKDDFGDIVAKGTYIFKIFAKSQNQDKCKGTATAIEKMVLLK